jgi:hypothetical protein
VNEPPEQWRGMEWVAPDDELLIEWLRMLGDMMWGRVAFARTFDSKPVALGGRGDPGYDFMDELMLTRVLHVAADRIEESRSDAAARKQV